MAKSISEFIQEQEVGTVATGSDNLVKAYAECAAALSLAQCYTEQATIMEFAAENDIDSLNIVQEADSEKKEGIFKRAGGAIKNAFKKFIALIKALIAKIKNLFTNAKTKAVAKRLSELDAYSEITVSANILLPGILLGILDEVAEGLKGVGTLTTNDVGELSEVMLDSAKKIDEFRRGELGSVKDMAKEGGLDEEGLDAIKDGKITLTVVQYQKLIGETRMAKVENQIGKINKALDAFRSKVEAGTRDDDMVNGTSVHLEPLTKAMSTFTNATTKAYDDALRYFNNITSEVEEVLKKNKKKLPGEEAKTESFYLV